MAYTIGSECMNCGGCVPVCPVAAISDDGGAHAIDADACIDCGDCGDACPVTAISPP